MNLEQALEIVRKHIRIGKGMELVNGVPEALEMVVEELMVMQKALELACQKLSEKTEAYSPVPYDIWRDYFLQKAKEAAHESK